MFDNEIISLETSGDPWFCNVWTYNKKTIIYVSKCIMCLAF